MTAVRLESGIDLYTEGSIMIVLVGREWDRGVNSYRKQSDSVDGFPISVCVAHDCGWNVNLFEKDEG